MINATQLAGYTMNPIIRVIRRWILRAQIRTMYTAWDHFDEQVKSGLDGRLYAHKKIVNLESELRDLQ